MLFTLKESAHAEVNLPGTIAGGRTGRESDIQPQGTDGRLITEAKARRKPKTIYRNVKRASGDLPEIEKNIAAERSPYRPAQLERSFD
jgi:hypothetical protein